MSGSDLLYTLATRNTHHVPFDRPPQHLSPMGQLQLVPAEVAGILAETLIYGAFAVDFVNLD